MKSTKKLGKILFGAGLAITLGFVVAGGNQAAAQTTCVAPPPNLISWWDGDAVIGTTAEDIEDGNNGTFLGEVSVSTALGIVGNAFSFDGVDDTIQVNNNANLNPTLQVTIDAWVKPSSLTGNHIIYRKDSGGNRTLLSFQARSFCFDGDTPVTATSPCLAFGLNVNGVYRELHASVGGFLDGNFHHVAATFDGLTRRIYLDGVLAASFADPGAIGVDPAPAFIGSAFNIGEFYTGLIDELEFFDRALTATEIADIYNAGSAGKCKIPGALHGAHRRLDRETCRARKASRPLASRVL